MCACTEGEMNKMDSAPAVTADDAELTGSQIVIRALKDQGVRHIFGYPGADLVTPVGGVLINVPRRPANAAHHLTLNPGDVATADITAYAIDTSTGNDCARWGNLVVTPPNGFVSHSMPVDVPICNASISTVD